MAFNHNPQIVHKDLIFCFDALDKNSYPGTGTNWTDIISDATTTLTNSPTFNSAGYFDFDGSNDYMSMTSDHSITAAKTISAWINTDSDHNGAFISVDASGSNRFFQFKKKSGGTIMFVGFNSSNNSTTVQTDSSIANNVWFNATAVQSSNGNVKIYINGSLVKSSSSTYTVRTGSATVFFGKNEGGSANQFNGQMATAHYYNRDLSAEEVLQNFNATKGRFGV